MKMLNTPRLGDDLVDKFAPQKLGQELSSNAGKIGARDLFPGNSTQKVLQDPQDGSQRLPFCSGIVFFEDALLLVNNNRVRAD